MQNQTPTTVIDGKSISNELINRIADNVTQLKKRNITPGLAVVLVGNDAASQVYVRNKVIKSEFVGLHSVEIRLPENIDEETVIKHIDELNADNAINGILVQLPLPKGLNEDRVINRIHHEKDVDGFHIINVGKLSKGKECIVPCTPLGSLILLKQIFPNLSGKVAAVVGRSNIVGKPMYNLLLQNNCTILSVHSHTQNPQQICKQADIVVAAVGKSKLIKKSWLNPGAVVIDVGINADISAEGKRKLSGDVDYDEVFSTVQAITPVPGGVGPMTIACLLFNCLHCTYRSNGLDMSELEGIISQLL